MQIANFKANGELITSAGSGGGAPTDATYITQTANGSLSAEQALASLSTGLMKVTTTTGVVSSVTDSAGLAGCLSDETGSGAAVFATAPTLVTPVVDGGADVVQLLVQAHATQTNPIAAIEKSDGTDLVTMGGTASAGLVHIIGNADGQVQLKVKGSASQSSNIVEVETSAGVDLFLINTLGGIVVNESGADTDSRFEGDTDANLLYIDAGQDAVAVGTAAPDDSAKFQIDSTTKGFLPPRLTTAQRDAVSSPIDGLFVYNSDTDVFNGYMNGAWGAVGSGGSGAMTQLVAWTVLGADTASVSMSSISGSYKHLLLTIRIRTDHTVADDALVRFNADTTAGNYYGVFNYATQSTTGVISNAGAVATITPTGGWVGADNATAGYFTDYFVWIMDYVSTSRFKIFNMLNLLPVTTSNFNHVTGGGQWLNSANAITAISIAPRNGSNLRAGTGYGLWGIV
jgi:hypothetical protein